MTTKVVKEGIEGTAFDLAPIPSARPYPAKNPVEDLNQVARDMACTDMKSHMVSDIISRLGDLDHSGMVQMYDFIQKQFGPNKEPGAVDNSAANAATIKVKGNPIDAIKEFTKEDINTVFKDETLTEEFKTRASVLFESAVFNTIAVKQIALQEDFDTALINAVNEMREELTKRVDDYLNYAAEEWVKENKLALEEQIKVDTTNSFLTGLKSLFNEHYIVMPEGKTDLFKQVSEELTATKTELEKTINENIELKKGSKIAEFKSVFEEVTTGMTVLDKHKLADQVKIFEESADSIEDYKNKITIVKESNFGGSRTVVEPDGVIQEDTNALNAPEADPLIVATAKFLAKNR